MKKILHCYLNKYHLPILVQNTPNKLLANTINIVLRK